MCATVSLLMSLGFWKRSVFIEIIEKTVNLKQEVDITEASIYVLFFVSNAFSHLIADFR